MKLRRILHEFWCALTFKCPKCGAHLACNDNEHEYGNWYCPNCDGNCEDEISIKEPTSDHWQDVRERAAIAAMQCIIKELYEEESYTLEEEKVARYSVCYADALVKKLKGE